MLYPYGQNIISLVDLYLTPGMKIKYQNLITHLQYIPNYFLEYNLSTPENVDAIQLTNFAELEKLRFSTLI